MTAALITGPAIEPVTLDEVKAHLRLDGDADDALLAAAIVSARIHVEVATRRALITQAWRLYRDGWPRGRIVELPVTPLISIDTVTLYDMAGVPHVLDPAGYRLDRAAVPGRIVFASRPAAALYENGIEIDVTAGYGPAAGDVPAPLRQAILMLVAHWYEHRGAVGSDLAGWVAPLGFQALTAPYRVHAL
ncbi:head-tail connector protein [Kaistia dalseonensis]|uniref:PhiE125 gp8 family phage protein n=1 Tax=Kaistia dalseonensis TaxID=410840 RepID=A0ABU0HD96_9HYPH|nr:head-tail connector protein [Kaistia dalseonensis]MCX5497657.1 head-tail connector protein [Kaistia dalseonensis]MDQ0440301.1 putative phiE125 gp8 family phage protein [Kaistia dalseonensis]